MGWAAAGLWCLWGFVWPAAASEPTAPATSVDVMTFNTWGLPYPIASSRPSRFGQISAYLRDADLDLAALQEVWSGARGLLDLANVRFPRDEVDSGLALVTPHDVDDVKFRTFTTARGFDRFKSKGVLRARVDLPGIGPVWVFDTHLQAGAGDANARVRAAQVEELLGEVAAVDGPALVLGDFNLHVNNPIDHRTHDRLVTAGLVDAAAVAGAVEPTYVDAIHRYDRVWVRDGRGWHLSPAAAEVVGYDDDPHTAAPPLLSDHRPVRVHLSVVPAP